MSPLLAEGQLALQLDELGLNAGDVVLVHTSLRAVGPVEGGGEAVLRALRSVLGPEGTVVVPTFTSANSDTSPAYRERVQGLSAEEVRHVRDSMPPFDPETTPSTQVGVFPEIVRRAPGALRSAHPQTSFAALGPHAEKILSDHRPDCHLGEDSPLARLYELRARVLLLGAGFHRCTAFHLGEYRVQSPPRRTYSCVIRERGRRRWWSYEDVDLSDEVFGEVGADLVRGVTGRSVRSGTVGAARCHLFGVDEAVDHARDWFPLHR
ncbi:AAC(3) family N-acetyltransferase [Streptomyces sp. NPDC001941]|uniref:aminoglycoside N(3)-acetyltransferase n=1 Tax=Streptomyces sp. NPDC001941 TaxID=3154659 RepID=UPI0033348E85